MSAPEHEPTDLVNLIKSRRTIHRYLAQSVDSSIVDYALEAAHQAPNHKNTWPWRFNVVGPETKAYLDAAALKMKETNGPLEGAPLVAFQEKRINPQLIVVSQRRSNDPIESKEDYAAVACAIQNMCLAFSAFGIGSKWSTGSLTRSPRAYQSLGIDDRVEEIVGFIWYGHPADVPSPKRPELKILRRNLP